MKNYLISALVPIYNAERFMRGLLEDLEAQTIADQLEIVIVDTDSPQNEGTIIEEFQQRYDNIVYERTHEWENSHAAMNRCIQLARGKYFTLACTDDRHRPDALELMVRVLEEHPEFGLVYADSLITNVENETFEHNSATQRYDWPDYNLGTLLSNHLFGPHPVWRREVHERVGYFNSSLLLAGDYDLYIRVAWQYGAVHLRETLGLFLQRDDSNSGRNNSDEVIRETLQVLRLYREQIPITDVYPGLNACSDDPYAMAAALWDFGNLCALSPYNDFELAMKMYEKSINTGGVAQEFASNLHTMFANNVGVLLFCMGDKQRAREFLQSAISLPAARSNLRLLEQLERHGKPAIPINFTMLQIEHPVVTRARRAYGLMLDSKGALVRTAEHEQVFWDVYVGTNGIPVSEAEKARAIARKPRMSDVVEYTDNVGSHGPRKPGIPVQPGPAVNRHDDNSSLHVLMTMYGWADEGGGTVLPRQIARALVRRGHRVSVIYTPARTRPDKPAYYVEESQEDGVQLFAIYNRPALFYDLEHPEREVDDPHIRRIVARLVAELHPDIVHYHSLLNFSMGITEEVSRAGVPSIYTSHNYWPLCPRMYLLQNDLAVCSGPSADGSKCDSCIGRFNKQADYARRAEQGRQMLGRHVNRHLANSHRVRQLFIQNGHEATRIHVLHQQPETVDWIWQQLGKMRKPEGPLARPLKVGYFGSLLPIKGAHVLVEALQAFQPDQLEGHIFGGGPEPYIQSLRKMDQKGLVQFHGRYEPAQLSHLLSQVDVVVVPSICEETAGLVVVESLAARVPVVGSRIGGIPDFIEDGINGFLFEPRDPAGLASILIQFISDPALLGRMQRNIQPPRGFNAYLDDLISHYRQVIAEHCQQVPVSSSVGNESLAVVWEGSQFVHHSLALINRELCLQLIDAGHEVSIIPYEPDQFGPEADPRFHKLAARVRSPLSRPADVHVRHQWPPDFTPPPEGHWVVIQPWEFGSLPRRWVEVMRTQVDELWVPSNYVRECYIRSGIPADQVYVVPNGVNTDKFRPDAPPLELKTKKRFKFLFVGGTIPRKGIDILLDAYINTFTADDDVCLVIKDMGGQSFYRGQTSAGKIRQIQANPDAPEILYLTKDMEPGDLPGLYTACDCLVHPYRGEGFGLPIAEAMACGLPVIVTNHGAALDFCTAETAYLIPAWEVRLPQKRIGDLDTVDYPWWAYPDSEALKRLMRHVMVNPAEASAKAQAARAYIQSNFTWERAAEAVQKRIGTLRRQPIRRLGGKNDLAAAREAVNQVLAAGQEAVERGDLETAAREFAQVTEKIPDLAAGHAALGSILVALGRTEEATPALRRATELAPQVADLHNQLGVALYQIDDLNGAESAFHQALQADPNDVQALLNLIELYRAQERYVEATEVVKQALQMDPNHADVLVAFGTLSLELGDVEGAQMALRRLETLQPGHPGVLTLQEALVYRVKDSQSPDTETTAPVSLKD